MIWRIRERSAFRRLSEEGRRTRVGDLWCTYLLDPSASPPRVAFAIGRAFGPAVVRNRTRRRLRMVLSTAPLPPGWYLVGGSPGLAERPFDALTADVAAITSRIVASRPAAASAGGSCD